MSKFRVPTSDSSRCISLVLGLCLGLAGCGDDDSAPRPARLDVFTDAGIGPTWHAPAKCGTLPAPGCECGDQTITAPCGQIYERVGSYVYCMQGNMTCTDGLWSECEGSRIQRVRDTSGGTQLLALGTTQGCGATGVCNPYCSQVEDSAQDLNVDPADDVTVVDNGITLKQVQSGGAVTTGCTGLSISPSPAALNITQLSPVSPNTVQFTANVTPAGCFPGTLSVLWAIDRFDVATISSTGLVTLAGPYAGTINVTAYAGSLTAPPVALNVTLNVLDTSAVTTTVANTFASTTTAYNDTGLSTLYPYANTVFPLGIGAPLIQWKTSGSVGAQAVKVSLRYPSTGSPTFQWSQIVPTTSKLYLDPPSDLVELAAGARSQIPESVWDTFEQVAKGATGAYVIQRLTTHSSGTSPRLGSELVVPIKFATNQLKGTVYYQSYGTNLVLNYEKTYQDGSTAQQFARSDRRFGAATLAITPGATYPTVAAGSNSSGTTGTGCRVCHTASADGSKLVTNLFTGDRVSALFKLGVDAPNGGTQIGSQGLYAWPAIYPDGSFLFSNAGPLPTYNGAATPGGLEGASDNKPNRLFSLATATLGEDISPSTTGYASGLRAATPVFSGSGNKLAFNHYAGTVSSITGDKHSLGMMDFSSTTKQFSNFRRLVTESGTCSSTWGTNSDPCTIVWPSFMPNTTSSTTPAGIVYERELFNNGKVSGATRSDFGGTRAGCEHATNACANEGTRAELWWTSIDSTPTARRLNAANGYNASGTLTLPTNDATSHTAANEGALNYEPTVNPQAVGGYYWVAFTSRRLYGNVATINP